MCSVPCHGQQGCNGSGGVAAARYPSSRAGQLRSPGWISGLACVETWCGIAVRIWNTAILGAFVGLLLGERFKNNHILQTNSFFFSFFLCFSPEALNIFSMIFIIISTLYCCCDWALINFSTSQIIHELIFQIFIQLFDALHFNTWPHWFLRHRNCFSCMKTGSRKSLFTVVLLVWILLCVGIGNLCFLDIIKESAVFSSQQENK